MTEEQQSAVLNIKELAAYLKIPKSVLYKLVRKGRVPQKIGRYWRFRKAAIDQWLDEKDKRARLGGSRQWRDHQPIGLYGESTAQPNYTAAHHFSAHR